MPAKNTATIVTPIIAAANCPELLGQKFLVASIQF
jgi:hypothetical protein